MMKFDCFPGKSCPGRLPSCSSRRGDQQEMESDNQRLRTALKQLQKTTTSTRDEQDTRDLGASKGFRWCAYHWSLGVNQYGRLMWLSFACRCHS